MKFEEFKAGVYRQQYQYKDFLPAKINHEWSWDDPRINVLLEKATKSLGELNAFTLIVPDVDLFIQMHIIKEANTSSRIEGTKTEMDEVLLDEKEIRPERRDDWHEVQNYVRAMNTAIEELESLPLSLRLLRQTHAILMEGVRGKRKTPGEFRRSQNWIGGASLADAVFIPPHHNDLPELLGDLEVFWHNENIQVPHLIRVALSHYQFETIHPFLDGNGRIGRLLITLYLVSHGLLAKPSLYLSAHLEKHRTAYYDALSRVREANDLGHWCRFFLQAVIETAENGKETFRRILSLRQEVDRKVVTLGRRAENARKLIIHLYRYPAVSVNEVMKLQNINKNPARDLIAALVDIGVLEEITGYRRNRIFVFKQYLDIFMEKK
ncbi:MAG: Fic family protein [Deltaproteobacteria bacterium]|nr:Fic family protein [Deltaproteobacteria bacterium]MBW1966272.1 Fic family protein [Deltaproteobacteria bacterium]MBW2098075.1 Fic family protein [Deltaproteobacteria bacterium]RKX57990.1 MAG: Fic family protein [Thermodesulfobacteriota bacterium]